MTAITVLGAQGFIGRHLVAEFRRRGIDVGTPGRGAELDGSDLGDVVYCIGLTADFRTRQNDAVEAHVCLLQSLLKRARLRSLVYFSSTRLYGPESPALEGETISADPTVPSYIYNLSKALGEAVTLNGEHRGLVVRLSNVFGLDPCSSNFLPSIIQDALHGEIVLRTRLESSKDYVAVDDAVAAVLALMDQEASGIFNVAGGASVTHSAITETLGSLTGCSVRVDDGAPVDRSPDISIEKLMGEIEFRPKTVLAALPALVASYRRAIQGH